MKINLRLSYIYICIFLLGAFASYLSNINPNNYSLLLSFLGSFLLSFILYESMKKIDKEAIKHYKKSLIRLLTIGIIFKIVILGLILYILTNNLLSFLIAGILAQIDPGLTLTSRKASSRTKSFLLAESTFDDPISVLLTVYLLLPLSLISKINFQPYLYYLSLNIFLFLVTIFLDRTLSNKTIRKTFDYLTIIVNGLLGTFLSIALFSFFQKGRGTFISKKTIIFANLFAFFCLGMFVPYMKSDLVIGVVTAFILVLIVRPLEVLLFFSSVSRSERLDLIFSEQKGLTTLLLLILIQPHANVIGVVLPAFVLINVLYVVINRLRTLINL